MHRGSAARLLAPLAGTAVDASAAGGCALGPVRAGERDPRTATAAPPRHLALGFAAGGAVAALLAAGGLWALDVVRPPWWRNDARVWWGALAAGPLVVAASGLPLRALTLRGGAVELPPAAVLLRRAAACLAALVLLAAALLALAWGGW